MVREAIAANIAVGNLPEQPAEPLTHLYVGSLNEAGLTVAHAEDPEGTIQAFVDTFERVMDAQRVRTPAEARRTRGKPATE